MVHTATLTYILQKEDFHLYQKFINQKDSFFNKDDTKWYNRRLRDNGIVIMNYKKVNPGITLYIFLVRINFKRLIEQKDRIAIMTASDTPIIKNKFDELMQGFIEGMPMFEEWKVNRIDYCVNVHTEYVEEYIKLLQKGSLPYRTKMIRNENRNKGFKTGSYYVVSEARNKIKKTTGSITINFYDKYNELLNQQKKDTAITKDIVEQGKNILRLEVQCHKPKTEYLKVKHNMTAKNIHLFLNPNIGNAVIERAIKQVCGTADYQRISVAESMIDKSSYTIPKKEQLKKLLKDIAVKHKVAVTQVRNEYISTGTMTQATFRNYMKCLSELNINPVTLSDNKHLQNKTYKEGLTSIFKLFKNASTQELDNIPESLDAFESDIEML